MPRRSVEGTAISGRIAAYVRQHHLALLALFLVLTGGTAYALAGTNTVFSDDIVDGNVRSVDVQDNGVYSADVRDDTLSAGGLGAVDLRPGSVRSSEVFDSSLTGQDVVESSFSTVPVADLGGRGASRINHAGCSPSDTTYVDCGYIGQSLPRSTRVLVVAAGTSGRTGAAVGACRLATSIQALPDTYQFIAPDSNWALTAVVGPYGPGNVDFGVECAKEGSGTVSFGEVQVSTVLLGPN